MRAEEPANPAGLHILVVDDEVEVADVLQEVLQSRGHHVATACNGQAALDRLGEGTYDLIVCDVKMPVLDGPGLYREIERRHPGLERRILFMTGDSLSVDVRQFLERSGMPILTKPFDPADVARAISQACLAAPAFDETTALEHAGGDRELLTELLGIFAEDGAGHLRALHEAMAASDPAALMRAAHTLKGSLSVLGAGRAAALAEQLEALGRAGGLEGAPAVLAAFEPELKRVLRAAAEAAAPARPA